MPGPTPVDLSTGSYVWNLPQWQLRLEWSADGPLSLTGADVVGSPTAVGPRPLVEVFTAEEHRARSSTALVASAVGQRLRVKALSQCDEPAAAALLIEQRDAASGLIVWTRLMAPHGVQALRVEHTVENAGSRQRVLTAVATVIGLDLALVGEEGQVLLADSQWLAEGRWRRRPLRELLPEVSLPLHAQDGRGRFALTSTGSWSTGQHLPVGVLEAADAALAWQVESGAGWQVELGEGLHGAFVTLSGPTEQAHQFAHRLGTGATFDAVPCALAVSPGGLDAVIAQLTRYRRWLRRPAPPGSPVIYNDFMNTLMGEPTADRLVPLVTSAAAAGAEVFCIDAGWFAPPDGEWWDSVGEWQEEPARFPDGLRAVVEQIRSHGMVAGTWLEPEVIGRSSPLAEQLPREAFFIRHGARVTESGRHLLDFRHPAARAHMDQVVDRLVDRYGFGYLKLDYNIDAGPGTEHDAAGAGDGLLGHLRAYRDWLRDIQRRHQGLLVENCASGAMRMDHALLPDVHLQSTSDQQDFLRYPPIAASAPMALLPEQCGNWSYPAAEMTPEQVAFTMVTGLSGRLYLSGFLDQLSTAQLDLVRSAVTVAKTWREAVVGGTPCWPLGLPGWDDDTLALGYDVQLDGRRQRLVAVWHRSDHPIRVALPGPTGTVRQIYPDPRALPAWSATTQAAGIELSLPSGPTARLLTISEEDA